MVATKLLPRSWRGSNAVRIGPVRDAHEANGFGKLGETGSFAKVPNSGVCLDLPIRAIAPHNLFRMHHALSLKLIRETKNLRH